jgi:hypothetical protein
MYQNESFLPGLKKFTTKKPAFLSYFRRICKSHSGLKKFTDVYKIITSVIHGNGLAGSCWLGEIFSS